MNRYLKFGIPVAAILATVAWLAVQLHQGDRRAISQRFRK